MERTEFLTDPARTLYSELRGNKTIIPVWAWGDEVDELDRDPRDPEMGWRDLENLPEEAFYADRRNLSEHEREAGRDPKANQAGVFEAAKKLFILLGLSDDRRPMCEILAHYFDPEMDPEPDCRMDGVINYFLSHKNEEGVADAAVEFAEKMEKYLPDISLDAIREIIREARKEYWVQNNGPVFRFGQALFGTNWTRLLGAA